MDSYLESENDKDDFFLNLMLGYKSKAIERFNVISNDDIIKEKFAKMLIESECEEVEYANYFIKFFGIDELDKLAIIEDLELFKSEYIEQKENEFYISNYEE